MDEPTAGLDPEECIRFRNLLAELAGDRMALLSTHIIEDIVQTCQRLAVLNRGQALFDGVMSDLLGAARGVAFVITVPAEIPLDGALTVISTQRRADAVRYHAVAERAPTLPDARVEPASPTLAESYVWLMRDGRVTNAPLAAPAR